MAKLIISLLCSGCCYYRHFFCQANYQRLTGYSRLYISNTFLSILAGPKKALFCITPTLHVYAALSHPPIKFCRNTSKGPYHYRGNFYISQFSQSSDLFFQILVLFHFFFSFFLYTYISWCSNINNYPLLFFLVNNLPISCQYYYYHYYFYYYHFY